MSLSLLEQMPYTNAVTKEVLRYRPPVIMVPYMTKKPFPINDEYTVPKGTMLIPSFWNVSFLSLLSPSRFHKADHLAISHSPFTTSPSTLKQKNSFPNVGCREE
jgi:cytochrome P450